MADSTSHAALPYPIRNARFSLASTFRVSAGTPTDPTTPDTEISTDGGATFTDCTEEITTGGSNGAGYITLTGADTNNNLVILAAKSANCLTTPLVVVPRVLAIVGSGTLSAGSAGGGTLGTILAYDLTGCFLRTTGGTGGGGTGGASNQARKMVTYTPSTGAFTVTPNWETTPDATTTYDVLLPEGVTLGMLRTLEPTLVLPAAPVANTYGEAMYLADILGGRFGTAQAGAASTITLDSGASTVDGRYVGYDVFLYAGTGGGYRGVGQARTIVAYVGSTKVATVAQAWGTNPDNTSKFMLIPQPFANVGIWNGTVVSTPATAGIPDVNAKNLGNSSQTGRDIGASVLLSSGTGTGQLKLASGYVAMTWADIAAPMTTVNLSGTTIGVLTALAADSVNASALATDAVTEIRNAITGGAYALSTNASGMIRMADGTATGELDTISGAVAHVVLCDTTTTNTDMLTAAGVWAAATRLLTAGTNIALAKGVGVTGFNDLSAAQVNAEVDTALSDIFLDKLIAAAESGNVANSSIIAKLASKSATPAFSSYDNTTDSLEANRDNIGTAGAGLTAADDATLTAIAVLNNITAASVWAVATRSLTTLSGLTLDTVTTLTNLPVITADWLTATGLATSAVQEIRNAITGGAYALNTSATGSIRIVDGTSTEELDTVNGGIAYVVLADTLTTYTGNTPQTGDSFARIGAAGVSLLAIPDLAGVTTLLSRLTALRGGYLDNLSAGSVALHSDITALNNVSTAQVLAQVEAALASTTRSMPGQAMPSTTPTLAAAVMQLFQALTNPSDQNATTQHIYDRTGSTVQQKRTITYDGATFSLGALVTGP